MNSSSPDRPEKKRISRRAFLRTSIALAGTTYLAACGAAPTSTAPTVAPAAGAEPTAASAGAAPTAAAAAPQTGGQAILGTGLPTTLNPAISAVSTTIYTTPLFFNGLTRPDENAQPSPDLAESWTISDDNLTYTFKLRQGVTFHDGQPFSAQDVKFTWQTICHPENQPARQLAGFFRRVKGVPDYLEGKATEIAGVTIVDDHTIKVELSEIYAPFLSISAGQFIIPQHIWKDVPATELGSHEAARIPVGTGPFVVESWTTNESIVANAFENYYEGRPKLDKLIVRDSTVDPSAAYNLLKSNELNVLGLYGHVSIDNQADAESDPNLVLRRIQGFANYYVEFNLANPLFEDVRVRKALSYATNRSALVDGLWQNKASLINSPIHPVFWASKADTITFDNNLEEAKKLLAEAGWTPGADGILEKDGKPFRVKFVTIEDDYPVVLQQQWQQVGVAIDIELMDFGSFWAPIYLAHKHEVAGLNLPFGLYLDPDYPLGGYFSSALNRNSYKNPRIDELIRLGTGTLDLDERKKYYDEFQELLATDVPHLWLGVPDDAWGITKGLVIPERKTGYLTIRTIKDWYWEA